MENNRRLITAGLGRGDSRWTEDQAGNLRAPIVMMTPGVRCGSSGCCLYSESALRASVAKWEDVPIVVNHPRIGGDFISIRNIDEENQVGHLVNPSYKDGLRAEAVITSKNEFIRQAIQKLREVSIGIIGPVVETVGTFLGKEFEAIAQEINPDHLALLEDEKGACGWADGCGIRANSKPEGTDWPLVVYALKTLAKIRAEKEEDENMYPQGVTDGDKDDPRNDEEDLYPAAIYDEYDKRKKKQNTPSPKQDLDDDDEDMFPLGTR